MIILFAASLSSCGSDSDSVDQNSSGSGNNGSSTKSDKSKAAIVESGFGQQDEFAWVTAVVENKSDHGGQTVTVTYNLKNATGKVVATGSQVEGFTGAGQKIAVGTQVELDKGVKPTSMDATLLVEDQGTFQESEVQWDPVPAKVIKDEFNGVTARFTVKNPTSKPLKDLRNGVVCKDKAGKINGGGVDFPELVPPSGEILSNASVLTTGIPAACTAYLSTGGI